MEIHQINFPLGTHGVCEVITGTDRRVMRTTTHQAAMALLGAQTPEDAQAARATEITWVDYLNTHGLAIGMRGRKTYALAIMPSKDRTVHYSGALGTGETQRDLTARFPALLIGVCKDGPRFHKGVIFCLSNPDTSRLSVTANANVVTAFPYGNVYAGRGDICWGSVPHGTIQTVKDLEDLFFGSDFNGDLYGAGGRLSTLVRTHAGNVLPLSAPTMSIPGVIVSLSA